MAVNDRGEIKDKGSEQGCWIDPIRPALDESAREMLENYRTAVEDSPTGIMVLQDGLLVFANPGICELMGYSREEVLGASTRQLVHPDDLCHMLLAYEQVIGGIQHSGKHEVRAITKNGDIRHFNIQANRVTHKGAPAVLVNAVDITDQKRDEKALKFTQFALDHAAEAIFWIGSDGGIIYANEEARRSLGYTPAEFRSLAVMDIDPNMNPGIWTEHWQELKQKKSLTFESRHRRKSGEIFPVEITGNFLEYNGIEYSWAFARDITERRQAEEAKQSLEKRLEEQQRQFYRDTIFSVTDGKLAICDISDIEPYTSNAQCKMDVKTPAAVSDARHLVQELYSSNGLHGERLELFMIAVGEAITNAIKHGIEGRIYAGTSNGSVWAAVSDKGMGIESLLLPKATLCRGFSTKPSLGLGYSIMLNIADRILLKTDEEGTEVVLVKNLEEPACIISAEQLPDTWDNTLT